MTEQELEMMELRRVALRRSDAREDREERLNLEGALELCHQVGLPIGNVDDLDSLVVQVRTVLAEIHTANERVLEALWETHAAVHTLKGAEAQVLELARHHHAYGAMIYKIREAWAEDIERKYGIQDGAWNVRRDQALALAEAERDLLAAALRELVAALGAHMIGRSVALSDVLDRHAAALALAAQIHSEEAPR